MEKAMDGSAYGTDGWAWIGEYKDGRLCGVECNERPEMYVFV